MRRAIACFAGLALAGCAVTIPATSGASGSVSISTRARTGRQPVELGITARLAQRMESLGSQTQLGLVVGCFDPDPDPTLGYASIVDLQGTTQDGLLPGNSPPAWWLSGPAPLADRLANLAEVASLTSAERREPRRWMWQENRFSPSSLPTVLGRSFVNLPGGLAPGSAKTYVIFALLVDEEDHVLGQAWDTGTVVEGQPQGWPQLQLAPDERWGATDVRTDVGLLPAAVQPEWLVHLSGFLTGGGSVVTGSRSMSDMASSGGGLAYGSWAGVAAHPGGFWLTDSAAHALVSIRPDPAVQGAILIDRLVGALGAGLADGETATAQLNGPSGLAADGPDGVIVADRGNRRLARWDAIDGRLDSLLTDGTGNGTIANGLAGSAGLSGPSLVAVRDNLVAFVDADVYLRVFDRNSGQVDTLLQAAGPAIGGLAFGPDGRLWYSVTGAHAIHVIDPANPSPALVVGQNYVPGNLVGSLAQPCLRHPGALAFDHLGRLWIADSGNRTLKVIGRDGNLHRWVDQGTDVQHAFDLDFRLEAPVALAWSAKDAALLVPERIGGRAWYLEGTAP